MKIIEPSVELVEDFDAAAIMQKLERAGRVCYKSEGNIKPDSAEKFIRGIIKRGHESVIEHATISFKIVCDRGVTHELVRHRIGASYSQESTRYCVAGDMKLTTINPHFNMTVADLWEQIQVSKNGSWKRLLIKQLNEDTGILEYARIKNAFKLGIKKIFQITTCLGYTLKCTADHEIYTPQGYAKLSELNAGDKIYVNGAQIEMADAIRKYHCNGRHDGEKIILKRDTSNNLETIFADEIKSVEHIGEAEVYDIEMNSSFHNFVANGVVVHNCDYSAGKFGGELTFIKPCFWSTDDENFKLWSRTMALIEKNYLALRSNGVKPEEARSILPNSLKTEIFVTMNLREWRHFFKLRTAAAAHPQMRQVALMIYDILAKKLPAVFGDINP